MAVAEELHFRRAAERLHVAQPGVSEQVRKVEDELGVRLLDRSQRSVSLTDAGAACLTEARRVLQRLATGMANLETSLQPGNTVELIEAVRAERLDAAIVSLPAPTGGLRLTPLGDEHAVAALPLAHRHAVASAIRLDQMLPERIVVLPREANRAF